MIQIIVTKIFIDPQKREHRPKNKLKTYAIKVNNVYVRTKTIMFILYYTLKRELKKKNKRFFEFLYIIKI